MSNGNSNLMLRTVQVLLWMFCFFDVIAGVGVNASPAMIASIASASGATVDLTSQFTYLGKMLGVYMVVIGLLAGVAARDPLKHRLIVNSIVLLLVLRVLQRLVFLREIESTFGIPPSRDLLNAAFFMAVAAVLFVAYRKASKTA